MAGGSLDHLLPIPASVRPTGEWFALRPGLRVIVPAGGGPATRVGERLAGLLAPVLGATPAVRVESAAAGDIRLELVAQAAGPEAYTVDITATGVLATAGTPAGLFYAVQTLRQLLPPAVERGGVSTRDWSLPGAHVADAPRYPYRGIMLDVARHFLDVATVKRVIELAALSKLNHLHLHLTDDQGWRIAIRSWPRLTEVGGLTAVGGGSGGWFTQAEYRELVAYAGEHFVTVVPEVDLPGHTNAALAAYPELAADGVEAKPYTGIEVGFSTLPADRELTYRFLDDVFGELAELTPGPYLHIGGDEALSTSPDDFATIIGRAQEIVARHGKTAIGWHEAARAKLAPTTLLQFWGTNGTAPDVVAAAATGTRLIMSPANRSYLDMKYDPQTRLGLSWAGHVGVADAYDWDPETYLPGLGSTAVLGVESPLWTETVETQADLDHLVFPRLAGTAEIGWSPAASHDWSAFRRRLGAQAPRWEALGVEFHRSSEVDWLRP